jgi:hypothetical protein
VLGKPASYSLRRSTVRPGGCGQAAGVIALRNSGVRHFARSPTGKLSEPCAHLVSPLAEKEAIDVAVPVKEAEQCRSEEIEFERGFVSREMRTER